MHNLFVRQCASCFLCALALHGPCLQLRLRLSDNIMPSGLAAQAAQDQAQQQNQQQQPPQAAAKADCTCGRRSSSSSIRETRKELFDAKAPGGGVCSSCATPSNAAAAARLRRTDSNSSTTGRGQVSSWPLQALVHGPQPSQPLLCSTPCAHGPANDTGGHTIAAAASAAGGPGLSDQSGRHAGSTGGASLALSTATAGDAALLQQLVADQLGLTPTEEGRQMLHYVIPQVRVVVCLGWLSARLSASLQGAA